MGDKRRCQATITVDRRGNKDAPCKLWAQHNSEYCNRHQGGGGTGTPQDADKTQRRCVARSHQTGEQCRNFAMLAQRVCKFHGGATKASRAKAQDLIDRMVEPALHELRDIMASPKTSNGEKLTAIRLILDRTMPKEVKHEVEIKPWEVTMQQVFTERAPSLSRQPSPEQVAELEAYMPEDHRVDDDLDDYAEDIEEAEIVEEDPRDALWQIRPADGAVSRATAQPPRVMVGSAEPPRRRRDEDD